MGFELRLITNTDKGLEDDRYQCDRSGITIGVDWPGLTTFISKRVGLEETYDHIDNRKFIPIVSEQFAEIEGRRTRQRQGLSYSGEEKSKQ